MPLIDSKAGYSRAITAKPAQLARSTKYSAKYGYDAQKAYTEFRERIEASDGVLFARPEHNRSVPAALKNASDVGLRLDLPVGSDCHHIVDVQVYKAGATGVSSLGRLESEDLGHKEQRRTWNQQASPVSLEPS
jgi:hypothetical protein